MKEINRSAYVLFWQLERIFLQPCNEAQTTRNAPEALGDIESSLEGAPRTRAGDRKSSLVSGWEATRLADCKRRHDYTFGYEELTGKEALDSQQIFGAVSSNSTRRLVEAYEDSREGTIAKQLCFLKFCSPSCSQWMKIGVKVVPRSQ